MKWKLLLGGEVESVNMVPGNGNVDLISRLREFPQQVRSMISPVSLSGVLSDVEISIQPISFHIFFLIVLIFLSF